ncbi:MAG: Uma2 family endonuclease [Pirellulales bacterium]
MSTTTPFTAEQLLALPSGEQRYELIAGELLVMSPGNWDHGMIIGIAHSILGSYVRQHKLGFVFGAETGFMLARDPDTVRAPDVAFIARDNLPKTRPKEAYWPGAPDLAVEVLSPSDTTGYVNQKIEQWLDAGCQEVWSVDPKLRTVTIYRSTTDIQIFTHDDLLDSSRVLPEFSCPVAEIFASFGSDEG